MTNETSETIISTGMDVPVPRPYESKYLWLDNMAIGQNVLTKDIPRAILGAAISNASKRTGFKFTQRKEGEYRRVWRIQ